MTKDKMTNGEKAKLQGMQIIFNVDICPAFECPEEGCDECPIRGVVEAQEDLMVTISKAVYNH